jgi:hypothetical protein
MRLLAPLGLAATLGMGTLPAFAQTMPSTTASCSTVDFQLANPAPGARVELGSNVIQGVAMDTSAPSGSSGIDRIDFFLGNRDQGGLSIGTAVPGMTPGPFGPGSFQTTITMPNLVGGHDLFAYAHDSVTGQESVISEPIALGEDASKAFVTQPPDTVNETCTGMAGATTTAVTSPSTTTTATMPSTTTTATMPSTTTTTTPSTTTTTPSTTTAEVAPSGSTVSLDVGNPSTGDTIHAGGFVIQGVAMDRSATSGNGIDRIDIFLDNRDEGGMFLGQAGFSQTNMWTATVTLPNNQLGLHTLWFYAHSSVNGQETTVSIPVTIAQ